MNLLAKILFAPVALLVFVLMGALVILRALAYRLVWRPLLRLLGKAD